MTINLLSLPGYSVAVVAIAFAISKFTSKPKEETDKMKIRRLIVGGALCAAGLGGLVLGMVGNYIHLMQ